MLYVDPEAEREEGQVSVPGPQPTSDPQGRTEQPAKHQAEIKPPPPPKLTQLFAPVPVKFVGTFFQPPPSHPSPQTQKITGTNCQHVPL